ncbi:hypothetical protein [Sulfitobacter pontiacus]|uniref:DUF7936 family protein n=1 Tax=Sulfitobacter pontiacus TaxID=60137 RepID=UPI003F5CF3C1
MTDPVISWSLTADAQKEMHVDSEVFENVIKTVHWRVTATDPDSDQSVSIYGSKSLPMPTGRDNFVDLAELQGMDPDSRLSTVIGWAEAIEPGFVSAHDQKVKAMLEEKLKQPAKDTVLIL